MMLMYRVPLNFALLFAGAATFSALLIYALYRCPVQAWFLDPPDNRKVHQRLVPRIGGIGFVLAFIAVFASTHAFFSNVIPCMPL
ncbi:MAG: hypothetical protein GF398_11195, partial [Chitinivibrionales bacterium]|nr:hypothetical protein [Chitinivibrionales bacterium]